MNKVYACIDGLALSGALGAAGGAASVFGVRRASDFLQKATMWLGVVFVVLCVMANLFFLPNGAVAPSAIQTGRAVVPSTGPRMPMQSAPAAGHPNTPPPAGGQPGT